MPTQPSSSPIRSTAFDFSYEVGWLNRRIATRFRGEDPGPIPTKFGEEWLEAPEELRTKEALAQYLRTTADELIAVIPEGLDKVIKVAENKTPAYQMLLFASLHTSYHDAQLNYIQSMSGDMTVHW
ncbi:MAG: hypothetical protein HY248_00115 [Fimbriimonas ginsengisoli]|nr:hypothetical protein [Fimbriimonas ginsengisoli]